MPRLALVLTALGLFIILVVSVSYSKYIQHASVWEIRDRESMPRIVIEIDEAQDENQQPRIEWSRDSKILAWTTERNKYSYFHTYDVISEERSVVEIKGRVTSFDWGPSRRIVLSVYDRSQKSSVMLELDVQNQQLKSVLPEQLSQSNPLMPRYSSDGKKIVYVEGNADEGIPLYIFSIASGESRLTSKSDINQFPVWLSDDSAVVYEKTSYLETPDFDRFGLAIDIVLRSINLGEEIVIDQTQGHSFYFWSFDAADPRVRYITFHSDSRVSATLSEYVCRTQERRNIVVFRNVLPASYEFEHCSMAADSGDWLAIVVSIENDGGQDVLLLSLKSETAHRLAHIPYVFAIQLSPNCRQLAFMDENHQVSIIDIASITDASKSQGGNREENGENRGQSK